MTDDETFLRRVIDVAPTLTDRQLARLRDLLGDELPSADALAAVRRLLDDQARLEQPGGATRTRSST